MATRCRPGSFDEKTPGMSSAGIATVAPSSTARLVTSTTLPSTPTSECGSQCGRGQPELSPPQAGQPAPGLQVVRFTGAPTAQPSSPNSSAERMPVSRSEASLCRCSVTSTCAAGVTGVSGDACVLEGNRSFTSPETTSNALSVIVGCVSTGSCADCRAARTSTIVDRDARATSGDDPRACGTRLARAIRRIQPTHADGVRHRRPEADPPAGRPTRRCRRRPRCRPT